MRNCHILTLTNARVARRVWLAKTIGVFGRTLRANTLSANQDLAIPASLYRGLTGSANLAIILLTRRTADVSRLRGASKVMTSAAAVKCSVGAAEQHLARGTTGNKALVAVEGELLAASLGAAEGLLKVRLWVDKDDFLVSFVDFVASRHLGNRDILPKEIFTGSRHDAGEREARREQKTEIVELHVGRCVLGVDEVD